MAAAVVGVGMGALWGSAGCEMFECRGVSVAPVVEKGTYVVTDVVLSHAHEWPVGSEVEMDTEMVLMRYEHGESTWNARYRVDSTD